MSHAEEAAVRSTTAYELQFTLTGDSWRAEVGLVVAHVQDLDELDVTLPPARHTSAYTHTRARFSGARSARATKRTE